jgi:hypothetical protein
VKKEIIAVLVVAALSLAACDDGPHSTTLSTTVTPNNWRVVTLFEDQNGCAAYYAHPVVPYSEWEGFKYVVCNKTSADTKTMWNTQQSYHVGKVRRTRTIAHSIEVQGVSPDGRE